MAPAASNMQSAISAWRTVIAPAPTAVPTLQVRDGVRMLNLIELGCVAHQDRLDNQSHLLAQSFAPFENAKIKAAGNASTTKNSRSIATGRGSIPPGWFAVRTSNRSTTAVTSPRRYRSTFCSRCDRSTREESPPFSSSGPYSGISASALLRIGSTRRLYSCFRVVLGCPTRENILRGGVNPIRGPLSQVEQARVDQTAVVPGSYGPPPCSDVAAFVHFGAAAVFFRRGKSGGGFPTCTAPCYLVGRQPHRAPIIFSP